MTGRTSKAARPAPRPRLVQNAYVVRDLDAAMDHWVKSAGGGPFFHFPERCSPVTYRGGEGVLHMRRAVGQVGPVHIELIQPLGDKPSVFSDMFKPNEEGFHHLGYYSDDVDADVARYLDLGCEIAMRGEFPGMSFVFIDARPLVGVMVELIQQVDQVTNMHKRVREAAEAWDGVTEPIRTI